MPERTATNEGRDDSLEAARCALVGGKGVLVVGERGAGRTHFVQSLIALLDDGTTARIRFGEDANRLTADRAERLEALVVKGQVLPVLTAAARRPFGTFVDRLLRDGLIVRIDLPPLGASGMVRAVENFIGGRLDSEAVPVFVPGRLGGDLVVLQEAVRAAQASGALAATAGTWRLMKPLPVQDGLRQVIFFRLGALTEVTRLTETILDLVSLAPGISLPHLERLLTIVSGVDGIGELETLEQDCVVDVELVDGVVRFRVHDPVIELVLPRTIGVLRRRRLGDAIIDVMNGTPVRDLSGGELMALTRFALLRERAVDPSTLNRAARDALHAYLPELALHLATVAETNGGGFDSQIALAAAESQLGRLREAVERLQATAARDDLDSEQVALLRDLGGLIQGRLDDPVSRWRLPTGAASGPEGFATAPTGWDSITEFTRHPAARPSNVSEHSDATALIEGEKLTTEASAAAMRGQLGRAHRDLDQAEAVLGPVGADMFRVHWTRAFVQCFDLPLSKSIELMRQYRDGGAALGHGVHQAMSTYLLGAFYLMAQRAPEAVVELRAAITLYQRNAMGVVAVHARPVLAIALALCGDTVEAEAVLGPALVAGRDPYLGGQILEAQAWIQVASGQTEEAPATFVGAADAHEADGFQLEALVALAGAARAGAALAVLDRVNRLAGVVEGACVAVFVRHARALARVEEGAAGNTGAAPHPGPDDESLALEFGAIGDEAARLGFHGVAAEAYSLAARLHTLQGDQRAGTAAARRTDEQVAASGLARLPFVLERSTALLSSREHEIALLAVAGASNKQIAERLVLSVRTIETHLLSIYRKLGIRNRTNLGTALKASEHPHPRGQESSQPPRDVSTDLG